jgi:hypothetical protein
VNDPKPEPTPPAAEQPALAIATCWWSAAASTAPASRVTWRPRPLGRALRAARPGAHTSSASTKLIHGGLRYLEYYEFGLVRKALAERERLLKSAPHIMWPLRFVMPHDPHSMRPVWMIRAGLFLYDHLARREWLPARSGEPAPHVAGAPLQSRFTRGFVYSDGWVDDARLVVLNAVDAAERGATRPHALPLHRAGATPRAGRPRCSRPAAQRCRCAHAPWSMPPAPGRRASSGHRRAGRAAACCGWSRAATSSCGGCSSTTTPTSSRTPTSASSSPSPTSRPSR